MLGCWVLGYWTLPCVFHRGGRCWGIECSGVWVLAGGVQDLRTAMFTDVSDVLFFAYVFRVRRWGVEMLSVEVFWCWTSP